MSAFPPPVNQLTIYNPTDFNTEIIDPTTALSAQLNVLTAELNTLTARLAKIKANTTNYYSLQFGPFQSNAQYDYDTGIQLVAGTYIITIGMFASYTTWAKGQVATTYDSWVGILNCVNPDAVAINNFGITYTLNLTNTFFVTYAVDSPLVYSHFIKSSVNPGTVQSPYYTLGSNTASPYNQNIPTGYINIRCIS